MLDRQFSFGAEQAGGAVVVAVVELVVNAVVELVVLVVAALVVVAVLSPTDKTAHVQGV